MNTFVYSLLVEGIIVLKQTLAGVNNFVYSLLVEGILAFTKTTTGMNTFVYSLLVEGIIVLKETHAGVSCTNAGAELRGEEGHPDSSSQTIQHCCYFHVVFCIYHDGILCI